MSGKPKKLCALLLCAAMAFTALTGCGKKEADVSVEDGLGPAGKEDYAYLHERDYIDIASERGKIQLTAVTPEDIRRDWKKQDSNAAHPRLFVGTQELDAIRARIAAGGDEQTDRFYRALGANANSVLAKSRPVWGLDDANLRVQSIHNYTPGLADAAFYYLLTPENLRDSEFNAKFRDKAVDYVLALCNYQDWGSGDGAGGVSGRHFLDTGVAAGNLAVFYDVMYDCLTDWQREIIRTALVDKALVAGFGRGEEFAGSWWSTSENNWNAICNGGLITAAMAVYGELEGTSFTDEKAEKLIAAAYNNMDAHIKTYYPAGNSEEGAMYWDYALMYLEYPLQAFSRCLGTTYGRMEQEFMERIPYSPVVESGPVAGLAIGDDPVKASPSASRMWFSYYYHLPDVQAYHVRNLQQDKISFRDLIYFRPETYGKEREIDAALDNFTRNSDMVSFRSGYAPDSLYASVHAGRNNASHGHLDAGQFDLQANGITWVYGSLGRDDYALVPGYFNEVTKPGYEDPATGVQNEAGRNHIYRIRTESKSAVVIKPEGMKQDIRQEQADNGVPVVSRMLTKERGGFAVVDLSDPYRRDVERYERGLMLHADRKMVTLQDEIQTKNGKSTVYWSVNLNAGAQISISEDGKSALVEVMGQYLYIRLASPSDARARFMMYDAAYYPNEGSFGLTTNQAVNSQKKLVVKLQNVDKTTLSVNFVPLQKWESEPGFTMPKTKPISEWNIPEGEIPAVDETKLPTASAIRLDGMPLAGFSPLVTDYEAEIPLEQEQAPVVSADAPGAKVTTRVNERYAFVFVEKDGLRRVYSIRLKRATFPVTSERLEIAGVSASAYQSADAGAARPEGYLPEYAVDGDLDRESRWSAEGAQYIVLDLGSVKDVEFVIMAVMNGNKRSQLFNVYLSEDGEEWKQMFEDVQKTSGTTEGLEAVKLARTRARYIKIQGYGNTDSAWNSIIELQIYGKN